MTRNLPATAFLGLAVLAAGALVPATAWLALFRGSAFEPTPEAILDRVHADDRDKVSALFISPGEGSEVHLSYRILLPDGEVRWLLDYSRGQVEEGVTQRVGICWDISDYQLERIGKGAS